MDGVETPQNAAVERGGVLEQLVVQMQKIEAEQDLACTGHCGPAMRPDGPDHLYPSQGAGYASGAATQVATQRIGFSLGDDEFDQR